MEIYTTSQAYQISNQSRTTRNRVAFIKKNAGKNLHSGKNEISDGKSRKQKFSCSTRSSRRKNTSARKKKK